MQVEALTASLAAARCELQAEVASGSQPKSVPGTPQKYVKIIAFEGSWAMILPTSGALGRVEASGGVRRSDWSCPGAGVRSLTSPGGGECSSSSCGAHARLFFCGFDSWLYGWLV